MSNCVADWHQNKESSEISKRVERRWVEGGEGVYVEIWARSTRAKRLMVDVFSSDCNDVVSENASGEIDAMELQYMEFLADVCAE